MQNDTKSIVFPFHKKGSQGAAAGVYLAPAALPIRSTSGENASWVECAQPPLGTRTPASGVKVSPPSVEMAEMIPTPRCDAYLQQN